MAYSMEDAMSEFFGQSKRPHYTEEQIELAKKRQKKCGGTFMDNLEAVGRGDTDGKAPRREYQIDKIVKAAVSGDNNTAKTDAADERVTATNSVTEDFQSAEDISAMIKDLNDSLQADYGVKPDLPLDNSSALKGFAGIEDVLKGSIYGQDTYIKKLIIAFKRPFVAERDDNDALNSVLITGPSNSGKHYSLEVLVKELGRRNIIKSGEVTKMDLSLYPSVAEETLFLQDLYRAITSKSSVILFENFDVCHISNLNKIIELVINGECRLQDRYVMKGGQLVSVSNALACDTVGTLEAKNKYLVFVSSKSVDKTAGIMGAPFVNALGDICATTELDEESLRKISMKQEEQLVLKSRKQLSYNLSLDDDFRAFILTKTAKGRGLEGILDTYTDILNALTELRLERDDITVSDIKLTINGVVPVIVAGDELIELDGLLPSGYNGEIEIIKEELNSIVGLKEVKEYVLGLEEYYGVMKLRKEAGLKTSEVNKHMIFTGNPGTGKTTIARIVSKYLKAIGVLSGGQLVEVSRGDLVGRYSGHTAPLTNQVIKSAIGGVLFIDEAYSLHRGREDSFGLEAIDTLVKGIEDNRDNLVVILAGYSKEMEEFLETNSGLKSRFPNIIDFPDYTGEELLEIAKITAKSKGYSIDPEAEASLKDFFDMVQATNSMEAGNGRLVRNKIEEAIINQSRRLVVDKNADMSQLVLLDFELGE